MPNSTKARDQFGLSTKEYSDRARKERIRTGKMRKRHLKDLEATEMLGIQDEYLRQMRPLADIA